MSGPSWEPTACHCHLPHQYCLCPHQYCLCPHQYCLCPHQYCLCPHQYCLCPHQYCLCPHQYCLCPHPMPLHLPTCLFPSCLPIQNQPIPISVGSKAHVQPPTSSSLHCLNLVPLGSLSASCLSCPPAS